MLSKDIESDDEALSGWHGVPLLVALVLQNPIVKGRWPPRDHLHVREPAVQPGPLAAKQGLHVSHELSTEAGRVC